LAGVVHLVIRSVKKMIPYFLLFGLAARFALSRPSRNLLPYGVVNFRWRLLTIVFSLAIGFRHEVGGDWFTYQESLETFASMDLIAALTQGRASDPAFVFLGWLSPALGGDYFVNLVCGVLFTLGLGAFCRDQPNPGLALTVAVPYLVIVVAMGYTRQGVAIGLSMLGMVALSRQNIGQFLCWIIAAAAFHKSAVILVPLALFSGGQRKWMGLVGASIIGPLVFFLFLEDSLERLFNGYEGMESAGALIRVVMNAFPAGVFLLWRKRFQLSAASEGFWTWMSIGALMFLPMLKLSQSSTAVDRLALYWVPIQIFVLSRLPEAMCIGPRSEQLVRHVIVFYSFSVLFVWLSFGDHSFAWLPYRFYPWEMLIGSFFPR